MAPVAIECLYIPYFPVAEFGKLQRLKYEMFPEARSGILVISLAIFWILVLPLCHISGSCTDN